MTVETWRLLDLGAIDPLETQIIYDMVAQGITEGESPNTIIICWPAEPLVSVGYFQEIEKDIDLAYCQANDIVVTRRVIGGGGVYLDDGQLFYQIIGRIDSPNTPRGIDAYYRKFLKAPVQAYRNLGIDAEFRPVNDIQVGEKKISGNGAGDVGDARILTGNLILDFDFEMMARVLKVPSEKFRDKVFQSLKERMSTIKLETGSMPDKEELKKDLVKLYEETLDIKLELGTLSEWEKKKMSDLRGKYLSDEWLHWRSGGRLDARTVKISADASLGTANHKAPGGLIRVTAKEVGNVIEEIVISGDFFMLPSGAIGDLEEVLVGVELDEGSVLERVEKAYSDLDIDSPGVTPEDLQTAVMLAFKQK